MKVCHDLLMSLLKKAYKPNSVGVDRDEDGRAMTVLPHNKSN